MKSLKSATNAGSNVTSDPFVEEIIALLSAVLQPLSDKVEQFRAERIGSEDARRRMMSPELKTTPNAARIQSLRAAKMKGLKSLEGTLENLFRTLTAIAIADERLTIYEKTEREIRGQRAERDQRQLSAMTYEFVDYLYTRYGVDSSMLGTLTEKQFREIAHIVKKHYASVLKRLQRCQE